MTEEEVVALLAGIDAPRPMPATLERDLLIALRDTGALAEADASRPLPDDLRRRLEATLTTASARPVPDDVRRRVLGATTSRLPRFAAAAAALILVVGAIAVGTRDDGRVDDSIDAASEQGADDLATSADASPDAQRELATRSAAPPQYVNESADASGTTASSFALTVNVVGDRSSAVARGFDAYLERLNGTGGVDGRTVATSSGAPGLLTVNLGNTSLVAPTGAALETAFVDRGRLTASVATVGSTVEVQAERAVAVAFPEESSGTATVLVSDGEVWDAAADAFVDALRGAGVRANRVRYAPGARSTGSATFLALSPTDARAHLAARPTAPSRGIFGLASAYDDRQALRTLTVLSPYRPAGGADEAALRAALPEGALTAEAIHGWVTAEAVVELLRRTKGVAVTPTDLANLAGWRSAWTVASFGTPAATPLRPVDGRFTPL